MAINADTLAHLLNAAGISTGSLHTYLETSARVAQQWTSSKHPPLNAQAFGLSKFSDLIKVIDDLDEEIQAAGDNTVLLRSFAKDDDITDLLDHYETITGNFYDQALNYLLTDHAVNREKNTVLTIPDTMWPGGRDELTMVVRPDTPLFAVAHRFPDLARLDLCVPRHGFTDPRPGVEGLETLTAVETLTPPPPTGDDVSASGLWNLKAIEQFADESGMAWSEEWRISGRGNPIASTAILLDDLDDYRVP